MFSSIDHVNLVVTDLDRMIDFYTLILGLKQTKRVTISGDWVATTVGLPAVNADVVYLDLEQGPRLELIRYNLPKIDRPQNIDRPNAPGLRHFAFRVTGIDAIVSRLTASGVKFLSPIQTVPETQVTYPGGVRKRIVYFQDPEGNLLELCEYK
jgi:catechol 2,3-dioxygenase-like lactoylglutathione lyase family enzyme